MDVNSPETLSQLAGELPEFSEALLQKAKQQEQRRTLAQDPQQFQLVLAQVEEALTQVEAELASHKPGKNRILLLRYASIFYSNYFLHTIFFGVQYVQYGTAVYEPVCTILYNTPTQLKNICFVNKTIIIKMVCLFVMGSNGISAYHKFFS